MRFRPFAGTAAGEGLAVSGPGGGVMRTGYCLVIAAALWALAAAPVRAEVRAYDHEYRIGDAVFEGYAAYDDAIPAMRPGVLVIHEWTGVNEHVKERVRRLAGLGYAAFAADIYGKGIRPESGPEAAKLAGVYRADRSLLRARAAAALSELRKMKEADPSRVAVIGYCFGGGAALELARSGAGIKGAVSFHGNLDTPDPADAKKIKGKVLVLHGADDPHVPPAAVAAFQEEMRSAGVDWQLVSYGGAVHSFTNPSAGDDPSKGAAYDARADRRSWALMLDFFREIFGR